MLRTLVGLVAAAVTGVAFAAPVTVIVLSNGVPLEKPARIELRYLRTRAELEKPPSRSGDVQDGRAAFDLADGFWSIDVVSDGYWHRRQFVNVNGMPLTIRSEVAPAAVITGKVALKEGGTATELRGRFLSETMHIPITDSECSVDGANAAFRCVVPAGQLDIRLRTPGHITRYFNSVELKPHEVRDLGSLVFEKGASLIGNVVVGRHASVDMSAVRVQAVPAGVRSDRAWLSAIVATVDERGAFHMDGLAPGKYIVRAQAPNHLRSTEFEVSVLADREAELLQTLRLELPARIILVPDPPRDPQGRDWHVAIKRIQGQFAVVLADSSLTGKGPWESPELHAGTYTVEVGPSSGGAWFRESVQLESESVTIPLDLNARALTGRVKLGEKPLAADLELTNENAVVKAASIEDGTFSALLPRAGRFWDVRVTSRAPSISRVVHHVDLEHGTVEIQLPLTLIAGNVIDEKSAASAYALVNISGDQSDAEPLLQVTAGPDGKFEIFGLVPGKYKLFAQGFLQQSDTREITVSDTPADPITLTLKDETKVRGRVMSHAGTGIPGAQVNVFPTDAPSLFSVNNQTDENGNFAATAPPASRQVDLCVIAPGFGAKMLHTDIPRGAFTVYVDDAPGTLVIPKPREGATPYLFHLGALEISALFTNILPTTEVSDDAGKPMVSIAGMESGAYALCILKDGQPQTFRDRVMNGYPCTTGYLAPFGTLTLNE